MSRVTLVVITHNRHRELSRTLDLLRQLEGRPPVIVVDNGSTDGTPALLRRRYPWVLTVPLPSNWGAVGRNLGVALARTPYVAFCDDDTWWEPGALDAACDALDDHPAVAVVTSHILVEPGATDDPICAELVDSPLPRTPDLPGYPLLSFLAGASVVRVAAYRAAGGFHPRFHLGGEEELLAADLAAAGWQLIHLPEAVIHHQASTARDPHLRRRRGIRNTLWFAWLRRPAPRAWRRTVAMAASVPKDRISAAGFGDALRGLGWVWRDRRPLTGAVESGLRLLDEHQLRSGARRYVS